MITVAFLTGKVCELPVVEEETTREFCLRFVKALDEESEYDTCRYILFSSGRIVNRVDNRHKPLKDCVDLNKNIHAVYTSLQPPSQQALVSDNLRADGFQPDLKTCAICMQDFTRDLGVVKGTFIALTCGHRFHMSCVAKNPSNQCAICRYVIDARSLEIIRMYGEPCSTD